MKELLDLHAFADGELPKEESRKMRDYISSDSAAKAELDAIQNLLDCLKQKSSTHKSEECWAVCVTRLNQLDRSKKVEFFVGKYAWAMCAILFCLVIGGRYAVKDVRGDTFHAADLTRIFRTSQASPAELDQKQQIYSDLLRKAKFARSGVRSVRYVPGTVLDTHVDRFDLVDSDGPLTFWVMQGVFNFEDSSQITSGADISSGVISNPSMGSSSTVNCVIWVSNNQTFVLAAPRSVETLRNAAVDLGFKSAAN